MESALLGQITGILSVFLFLTVRFRRLGPSTPTQRPPPTFPRDSGGPGATVGGANVFAPSGAG